MSDPFAKQPVSGKALFAMGALVVFALLAAITARVTDVGTTALPQVAPAESRLLSFSDQPDGSVAVATAETEQLIHVVKPGEGGFVRGVLRGLARQRKLRGIGPEEPFQLTRWSDGRLSLIDPSTKVRIDLEPFGPANVGAFASMLQADSSDLDLDSQVSLQQQ